MTSLKAKQSIDLCKNLINCSLSETMLHFHVLNELRVLLYLPLTFLD